MVEWSGWSCWKLKKSKKEFVAVRLVIIHNFQESIL